MPNTIVIKSTNEQEVIAYRDAAYKLLLSNGYDISKPQIDCTVDSIGKIHKQASLAVEPIRYATEHGGDGFSVIYFKYIKYNGIGMGWHWGLLVTIDDNNLAIQLKLMMP